MNRTLWTAAASVAALGMAMGVADGAAAQSDDEGANVDDVIIVTTQKREQSLIDVPVNVTALDGAFLDDIGVDQFDELSAIVPGLVVQEQSPNNAGFVIRGITSDSGEATQEPRVAVFQDGVSIAKSRGSYVELFDVERVEVVKGPQPTLFGRGALIGAINIIQNKADYTEAGELTVGFGEDNYRLAEGFVNIPLAQDVAALRLAGIYKERDGYIENELGGENLQGVGVAAFRASLRLDPTENLRIDVIANYQEDDTPGTSFKSGSLPPPSGDLTPFNSAALNTFGPFEGGAPLGLDRNVWGVTGIADLDISDTLSVTSITAYREFDSVEIFDPDGFAGELLVAAEDAVGEQFSQELRLNFAGQRFEGFLGGNYFYEEGSQRVPLATNEAVFQAFSAPALAADFAPLISQLTGAPVDAVNVGFIESFLARGLVGQLGAAGVPLPFDPADPAVTLDQLNAVIVGAGQPAVEIANVANPYPFSLLALFEGQQVPLSSYYEEEITNSSETTSYDLFADVTVDVTEKLAVSGGLRWTYDEKTSAFVSNNVTGPSLLSATTLGADTDIGGGVVLPAGTPAFNAALFAASTPNGEEISATDEFDALTWRAAANYRWNDDFSTFASYARGRRPEVITAEPTGGSVVSLVNGVPIIFNELEFVVVPEETVDSFELGAKAQNLFNGVARLNGSVFYSTYENFQTQIIDLTTGGVRTENAGEATQYGFEGEAFWSLGDSADLFATYAYNFAEFDGANQAFDGNVFRLNPEQSFALGGSFTYPVASAGDVVLTPIYTWQSEVFFDNDNDLNDAVQDEFQDSYGLLNVRLRFDHASDRWSVEGFVTNALDEEFIIDAGNTGDSLGVPTFIAGPPRLWGVNLTGRF